MAKMETPKSIHNQSTRTLLDGDVLSLPKGWRELKLGDIVSKVIDNRGRTLVTTTSGYALFEVNTITYSSKPLIVQRLENMFLKKYTLVGLDLGILSLVIF